MARAKSELGHGRIACIRCREIDWVIVHPFIPPVRDWSEALRKKCDLSCPVVLARWGAAVERSVNAAKVSLPSQRAVTLDSPGAFTASRR